MRRLLLSSLYLSRDSLSDEASATKADAYAQNSVDQSSLFENAVTSAANISCKARKRVRFADECGEALSSVRVMTEPSDYPPSISPSVIRKLFGDKKEANNDSLHDGRESWILAFKQPASEYVKFRETVDKKFISLENVMLKNEVGRMVGTVKVKNITFEKKVFVRFTSDNWKTFVDHIATYQPSSSKFYDTFSFDLALPKDSPESDTKVEFCVCFEAGASNGMSTPEQYWDSNDGRNYVVINQKTVSDGPRYVALLLERQALKDVYTSDYENWAKFAAWKNLSTEGPYW